MLRILSFFAATVLLACHDRQTPASSHTTDSARSVAASRGPVIIDRPTFIATFAASQAFVDSNDDAAQAFADYEYQLADAIRDLEKHGVHVQLFSDSTIRWRDSLGEHALAIPDSNRILYLFLLPSGRDTALRDGVAHGEQILSIARDFFHLPIRLAPVDSSTHDA